MNAIHNFGSFSISVFCALYGVAKSLPIVSDNVRPSRSSLSRSCMSTTTIVTWLPCVTYTTFLYRLLIRFETVSQNAVSILTTVVYCQHLQAILTMTNQRPGNKSRGISDDVTGHMALLFIFLKMAIALHDKLDSWQQFQIRCIL